MFKDLVEQYTADETVNKPDDTNITQVILYYGDNEINDFKTLAKIAMKVEFPDTFQHQNLSDILLHILKKNYAK